MGIRLGLLGQRFKTLRGNVKAQLLVHFSDHAFEKTLICFPMSTEQAYLAWIQDARIVVAKLQKKTTRRVKQDSNCEFSPEVHDRPVRFGQHHSRLYEIARAIWKNLVCH
jgi:hypothetical protein